MQAALDFLKKPNRTLLCVGPLSSSIIDSSISISKKIKQPILMVASRRQLDASSLKGGYVNGWDTETFAKNYLPPKHSYYAVGRDHGGPGQGEIEWADKFSVLECMNAAKKSFEVDILSGFNFLHIDPSIPLCGEILTEETTWKRLTEIYSFVIEVSKKTTIPIHIEVGTEEQCGLAPDPKSFEYFLRRLNEFTKINNFPLPFFVVLQTGTKVQGLENIGLFERGSESEINDLLSKIKSCAEIARKYGVFIKEHNADYLSEKHLRLRPALGISASNVAPEFGAVETNTILNLLTELGLKKEFEEFCEAALKTKKWKKWLEPGQVATDLEKVKICGHYSFASDSVKEIRSKLNSILANKGKSLDSIIGEKISSSTYRYLHNFGYDL